MPNGLFQNPRRVLIPWGSGRAFAPTGTGALITGRGCIAYNGAFETSGSAGVTVNFYDGAGLNGQSIVDYTLTQGQSTSEMFGLHWVQFVEGLYVASTTTHVSGTITAWVDHDCGEYNGAIYRMAVNSEVSLGLQLERAGVFNGGSAP